MGNVLVAAAINKKKAGGGLVSVLLCLLVLAKNTTTCGNSHSDIHTQTPCSYRGGGEVEGKREGGARETHTPLVSLTAGQPAGDPIDP